MISRRRRLSGNQRGFTIVEMMVTLALTAVISLGASMASAQVLNQTSHNANYVTASRQAMNAISWISRDAQMAQVVDGASSFPAGHLVFTWTTWDNDVDRVVYSLSNGQLRRAWAVNDAEPVETVVAEYINPNPSLTGCDANNNMLSLKITASVGQGSRISDVTLTHDTTLRPKL